VQERLSVNADTARTTIRSSAGRLLSGSKALGYHAAELPRNVVGCGEDCGTCHFGCRSGAKQSTTRTFLADAFSHGARIIPDAHVGRVLIKNGRTIGVEGTCEGRPFEVRAPRVVLAGGAIGSPAILLRSGLDNPNIGRHLHLHPVVAAMGSYEESTEPWRGRQLSAFSKEFQRIDGNYGFLLEVAPAHPGTFAMFSPWQSGVQYQSDLRQMGQAGVFIVVTRDRDAGRVTVNRAGRHQIDYPLSAYDRRHVLLGQQEALRIHHAAGAIRLGTLHSTYNVLDDAQSNGFEPFLARTDKLPSGPNELMYLSAHQMGTCRMGKSSRSAVADPTGRVYGVEGLYVCDTSAFPSASGVNPMITVMSLAKWIAEQID
jgi:choline dehydrogenase-like flavoprotein